MSVEVVPFAEEEPPSTSAQRMTERASSYLLYFLCVAPIALFPVGLIYKTVAYFFPSWLP
jgi:hypothetical protein